jgi:cyclopropane fatty-acyl-phospholipid synthase-like methyltransferase
VNDTWFTGDDHYFHDGFLTDQRADDDAAEILGLLDLAPGARILDAGCGDGRIVVRLASLGFKVVGIDQDPAQVRRAQVLAAERGIQVDVNVGAIEEFSPAQRFDAGLLWFTTWGFGSAEENRAILAHVAALLVPGGRLVLETLNPASVARYVAVHPGEVVTERGGNRQIDRYRFDAATSVLRTRRRVERDGRISERSLMLELHSIPEWRSLLASCGFFLEQVTSHRNAEFDQDSWEMVVVARRTA